MQWSKDALEICWLFLKDFSKLSLIINFYPTQHTNFAAVYNIFYSNNIGCIYFIHDIFTTLLKITINIHTNIITHTIDSQNYMHTHDLPLRRIQVTTLIMDDNGDDNTDNADTHDMYFRWHYKIYHFDVFSP